MSGSFSAGVVVALDEDALRCRAIVNDAEYDDMGLLGGRVPYPGAPAIFDVAGRVCLGPVGERRYIVREHFTKVPSLNVSAAAPCDKEWRLEASVAGASGIGFGQAQSAAGAAEFAQLTNGSTAMNLFNGPSALTAPPPPAALLYTARVRWPELPDVAMSWVASFGFDDQTAVGTTGGERAQLIAARVSVAPTKLAWYLYDNSCILIPTELQQPLHEAPLAAGIFFRLYVLIQAGQAPVAWVGANGPYRFPRADVGGFPITYTPVTARLRAIAAMRTVYQAGGQLLSSMELDSCTLSYVRSALPAVESRL